MTKESELEALERAGKLQHQRSHEAQAKKAEAAQKVQLDGRIQSTPEQAMLVLSPQRTVYVNVKLLGAVLCFFATFTGGMALFLWIEGAADLPAHSRPPGSPSPHLSSRSPWGSARPSGFAPGPEAAAVLATWPSRPGLRAFPFASAATWRCSVAAAG